jgi:hypothetical protein
MVEALEDFPPQRKDVPMKMAPHFDGLIGKAMEFPQIEFAMDNTSKNKSSTFSAKINCEMRGHCQLQKRS